LHCVRARTLLTRTCRPCYPQFDFPPNPSHVCRQLSRGGTRHHVRYSVRTSRSQPLRSEEEGGDTHCRDSDRAQPLPAKTRPQLHWLCIRCKHRRPMPVPPPPPPPPFGWDVVGVGELLGLLVGAFVARPAGASVTGRLVGASSEGPDDGVEKDGTMDGDNKEGTMDGVESEGTMDGADRDGTMDGSNPDGRMDGTPVGACTGAGPGPGPVHEKQKGPLGLADSTGSPSWGQLDRSNMPDTLVVLATSEPHAHKSFEKPKAV
jgi:hypothetical protein